MSEIVQFTKTSCEAILATFGGKPVLALGGSQSGRSGAPRTRRRVFRRVGSA